MPTRARTGIFPHRIDHTTGANTGVDYGHKEVHSGDAYYVTGVATLDNTDTFSFIIETSNTSKWLHLEWLLESQANITVQMREGVTFAFAAEFEPCVHNRNRNFADTDSSVYSSTEFSTVVATGGDLIYNWSAGGAAAGPNAGRSPMDKRDTGEIVLKQNTKYEIRMTSTVNANVCSMYLTWYEHTNAE